MRTRIIVALMAALSAATLLAQSSQSPDWPRISDEVMRHFQDLVRIDSTDPPGNETQVADYVKRVFDAEKIQVMLAAKDPKRANVIARLKGNGSKRPLLIMGHSDEVQVDASKWSVPPFSAARKDGYVYGRGTLDDKPDLVAAMMTMVLLKRANVPLDRDVIFVSEAGEEAATGPGIEYLVANHWSDIDAEYCLAESGGVTRQGGKATFATTETTEKRPRATRIVAHGPAGHGSRPLRTSAVVHLAQAVARIAAWEPPMRLNETTREYFERLARITPPDEAAHYSALLAPQPTAESRAFFATADPGKYSMLHTSISPTMLKAGYQINVIPSEAEATLDIRALPDENMDAFYAELKRVIADPSIDIIPSTANERPGAEPSPLDSDAFRAVESAYKSVYGVPTLPLMSTGATDMAFLRAKGMKCYGVGPMVDSEDAAKGFGLHSDQERILEDAVYKHVQFFWNVVTALAAGH